MIYNQIEVLGTEVSQRYIDKMYETNAKYISIENHIIRLLDEDYEVIEEMY